MLTLPNVNSLSTVVITTARDMRAPLTLITSRVEIRVRCMRPVMKNREPYFTCCPWRMVDSGVRCAGSDLDFFRRLLASAAGWTPGQKISKTLWTCTRNLSHPQSLYGSRDKVKFVFGWISRRFLSTVAPLNGTSASQTWKFHLKELFFLFHLRYDVHMPPRRLPFEKNQDF